MAEMLKCLLDCGYDIDHIALSTFKHNFNKANYPEEIRNKITVKGVCIDTRVKPFAALKALLSGKSLNISRFESKTVHYEIKALLSEKNYDLIFLESLYTTPYIDMIRAYSKGKIILRTHNVEHALWEQRYRTLNIGIKKWYIGKLARDLKKYEEKTLQTVDKLLSISSTDTLFFATLVKSEKVSTIPVSLEQNTRAIDDSLQSIFFVGSMNWYPNVEAVKILIEKIFPKVRSVLPKVELHLAGSFMHDLFSSQPNKGIFNHGYVENIDRFMTSNGIMVLPILSGSGVRIKILEAMALGVPIITFPEGASGVETSDGLKIVACEEEMISAIIALLQNDKQRMELGNKAWECVHSNLSHTEIVKKLRHELSSI
jgi:glycosyltransferase involved in cell wall biosynthesis